MRSVKAKDTIAEQDRPVIEAATIRLTADETKALIKAHLAAGKPVSFGYNGPAVSLIDMGLMQVAKPVGLSREERLNELWDEVNFAVQARGRRRITSAFEKFDRGDSANEIKQYVLTDSGKQIARGITIKLNSQYAGKR